MSKTFSFDPQKLVTELSYEINEATSTQDDVKSIVEFINTEMDTEEWGMTPTPRQWVILKTFYGLELTIEEISVLEQWQREERTTWDHRDKNQKYQCLILESGRRSGKCVGVQELAYSGQYGLSYMYELLHPDMPITQTSLIPTSKGLAQQLELATLLDLVPEDTYSIDFLIAIEGKNKTASATSFYVKGQTATKKISTFCGYEIDGTPQHRIKYINSETGTIEWGYLGELKVGDRACIHRTAGLFPVNEVEVGQFIPTYTEYLNYQKVRFNSFPTQIDTKWGYLMGLLAADGSWTNAGGVELSLHRHDKYVYEQALIDCEVTPYLYKEDLRCEYGAKLNANHANLRRFLDKLGWCIDCKPDTKMTPWSIRRSPKHVVAAYLSGLFDGDGSVEKDGKAITFSTASKILSIETQLLLLNFGIVCFRKEKMVKGKPYYLLSLRGRRSMKIFVSEIGFKLERKQTPVLENLAKTFKEGGDTEKIPYQKQWLQRLRDTLPTNIGKQPGSRRNRLKLLDEPKLHNFREEFRAIVGNSIKENSEEHFSGCRLDTLVNFAEVYCDDTEAVNHFKYLQDCDYFYDEITLVEDSEAFCVDLSVPSHEHYVSQGFTSHNTLCASVIILYEFYKLCRRKNPQKFYGMPASIPITILVLATSAQQAKETIFAQFANTIQYCHYFKPLIEKEIITVGVEAVRHRDKSINVFSGSSKSSSQVGHAIILLVMDEIARFKADGEDGEALQLWTNLGASGIGFDSDAKKLALSSAWCEGDAIEILYKQSGIEPSYLGFRLRTWDVNPRFHRQNPVVSADYNTNPRKAAVDYEGLRFADSEAFFNSTEVANCFRGRSVIEVMTQPNSSNLTIVSCESGYEGNYVYLDPSVITDSYSGAFGRSIEENGRKTVIVDGLLDWIPTIESNVSILNVQQCLTDIHDKRPFVKLGADHHNSAETVERMKLLGIDAKVYYATNKLQLEQYEIVRTLMHDGRLILPLDSQWRPNLSDELVRVQLINGLKIDHVRGKKGKKDLADAVAGLCWLIITNGNSIFNQPEVFDTFKKRYVNPDYKPPVDYGFNSSRDQLIQGQQRKSFSQFQSRFNK